MSTAPIFAPDGTVRQIPQDSLQDALSAGGKRATLMTDPTGTLRYIPEDQVNAAMQAGGKLYQDPNAPPNTLGDMADVALQGLKGIAQISAPGIAASLINKTAPGLAAKLQQVPYIGPLMQQAAPLKQIPGMATAAMASPLAEGMETGDLDSRSECAATATRARISECCISERFISFENYVPPHSRHRTRTAGDGYGAGFARLGEWPGARLARGSASQLPQRQLRFQKQTAFPGVAVGRDRLSCAGR